MKNTLLIIVMGFIFIVPFNTSYAQVDVDVEGKLINETDNRANSKTDQAIDKGFDAIEDGIGSLFGKKKKKKKKEEPEEKENKSNTGGDTDQENSQVDNKNEKANEEAKDTSPVVNWSKYDFVPGDEVIFEDGPAQDEENGEFPSRWDLDEGSAEIGEMDGEPVIMFLDGGGSIIPYLKNSNEDYLPQVFTMEFDAYFEPGSHFHRYWITFQDNKNQWNKGLNERMNVYVNGIEFLTTDKRYPGTEKYNWSNNPEGGWKHISVAYTKGKFKAYMDDTRLINIPHLEGNPWGITIEAENGNMFIKNIRIAKGGVKYYDRVLSDGKIIVNGIRFDVNKATIKPESMGAINKIYKILNEHPDLDFSVEGHTDGDGDEANNQKLSEDRAEAVMDKLISMGISADRLSYKGFGESKPLYPNTTPEGKANNRRVEFVKQD
ncbi:MAG: OmpA family protein [Bacteroidetes bacterium]|nr:MAG: OmpA family protein [Bacteroidota bacterium]